MQFGAKCWEFGSCRFLLTIVAGVCAYLFQFQLTSSLLPSRGLSLESPPVTFPGHLSGASPWFWGEAEPNITHYVGSGD